MDDDGWVTDLELDREMIFLGVTFGVIMGILIGALVAIGVAVVHGD